MHSCTHVIYPRHTFLHPRHTFLRPRHIPTPYNIVAADRCLNDYPDLRLYPVLSRMGFDTKERYKFFCLARQRACAIGSGPRHGHSALRRCTPHAARADLPAKRRAANDSDDSGQEDAAASLSRRGLHPRWRCTALEGLHHAVVQWTGRLYYGLFNYDVMHCLFINCIGYLLETLLDALTPAVKQQLDLRVKSFSSFRSPSDGIATPKVTALSSTAYLTAEMMVVHLFVWSHALGSKALVLPAPLRHDALVAIVNLQIICYSVRGLRPFSVQEHRFIFGNLGRKFFRAISNIHHAKLIKKIRRAEAYNVGKPPAKRRRVPHWRAALPLTDESSDTTTSTDSDCPPYFIRSSKIIPHAFVHFADQVKMGGTHRFYDTCAQEAHHTRCLGVAGQRARTYNDLNQSSDAMLSFMGTIRLLKAICRHAGIDGAHVIYARHIWMYTRHIRTSYMDVHTSYTHVIYGFTHAIHPHHIWIYPRHTPTSYMCPRHIFKYPRHKPHAQMRKKERHPTKLPTKTTRDSLLSRASPSTPAKRTTLSD